MNYREQKQTNTKTKNKKQQQQQQQQQRKTKQKQKCWWLENNWGPETTFPYKEYLTMQEIKSDIISNKKKLTGQSKQILCDISMSIKMRDMFWTHCSAQHPLASAQGLNGSLSNLCDFHEELQVSMLTVN